MTPPRSLEPVKRDKPSDPGPQGTDGYDGPADNYDGPKTGYDGPKSGYDRRGDSYDGPAGGYDGPDPPPGHRKSSSRSGLTTPRSDVDMANDTKSRARALLPRLPRETSRAGPLAQTTLANGLGQQLRGYCSSTGVQVLSGLKRSIDRKTSCVVGPRSFS